MKVGVLTIPFNNNYGGYLQCYALMSVLRNLGHDPILINRRQNINANKKNNIKAFIANKFLHRKERMYSIKSMETYYAMKGKYMYPFVAKYIYPKTQPLYGTLDYCRIKSLDLDVVIVGSDQVWRPKYVPDIEEYFLKYIPNSIRKIAYAASLGSENVEYSEQELCKCSELLKVFHAVSVREESGKNIIQKYLRYKKDVQVVLDPTMLLSQENYHSLIKETTTNGNILFAYILDRTEIKDNLVRIVASNLDCKVFDIMKIGKYEPFSSIEDWLNAIYSSKFVITDSFHGTVFSILFNKPFLVVGNENRGNGRILDLLSLFGLEDRLVEGVYDSRGLKSKIDWNNINKELDYLKEQSIHFLRNSLINN